MPYYYCCPQCKRDLTISSNLLNCTHLKCLSCGKNFENPYYNTIEKEDVNFKKTHYTSAKKKGIPCFVQVLLFIAFVSIIGYIIGDSSSDSSSGSSLYYINTDTYAATSQSAWDAMGRYSVNNDLVAINMLMSTGQIVSLNKGTEVYLEKSKFSYNIVKLSGTSQQLWVHVEHMTRKK